MSWNYRLMAQEQDGEIFLQIHEVYYDDNKVPHLYSEEGVSIFSESVEGVKWVLEKMSEATTKPILWAGDKFPDEYQDEI